MQFIDYANLNVALDLLQRNEALIEEFAHRSVTEFGFTPPQVVIICGVYNSFWAEFVDGLNPDAKTQALPILQRGETPISVCAGTIEDFTEYLSSIETDIAVPQDSLKENVVRLLVLHERGHTWLTQQIPNMTLFKRRPGVAFLYSLPSCFLVFFAIRPCKRNLSGSAFGK